VPCSPSREAWSVVVRVQASKARSRTQVERSGAPASRADPAACAHPLSRRPRSPSTRSFLLIVFGPHAQRVTGYVAINPTVIDNSEEERMSSPGQAKAATQQAAGQTAAAAKDEASQVTTTATSAAGEVAGTAKEQAGAVAGEAASQVRGLLDQARTQVSDQAGGAQSKLSEGLRSLAAELEDMGQGGGSGSGPAAEVARQVAERGYAVADYLGSKNPSELVQELRAFASRRPGAFLLGALGAGLLTGRLVRGATADSHEQSTGTPALRADSTTYGSTTTYGSSSTYDSTTPYSTGATYGSASTAGTGYDAAYDSPAVTRSGEDVEATYVEVDPVVPGTTRTTYGSDRP